MKPQILLLDEPTSALDPELVGEVLDVIRKVAAQGYTMLLVSHEMNFIRHVSKGSIRPPDEPAYPGIFPKDEYYGTAGVHDLNEHLKISKRRIKQLYRAAVFCNCDYERK